MVNLKDLVYWLSESREEVKQTTLGKNISTKDGIDFCDHSKLDNLNDPFIEVTNSLSVTDNVTQQDIEEWMKMMIFSR